MSNNLFYFFLGTHTCIGDPTSCYNSLQFIFCNISSLENKVNGSKNRVFNLTKMLLMSYVIVYVRVKSRERLVLHVFGDCDVLTYHLTSSHPQSRVNSLSQVNVFMPLVVVWNWSVLL